MLGNVLQIYTTVLYNFGVQYLIKLSTKDNNFSNTTILTFSSHSESISIEILVRQTS